MITEHDNAISVPSGLGIDEKELVDDNKVAPAVAAADGGASNPTTTAAAAAAVAKAEVEGETTEAT